LLTEKHPEFLYVITVYPGAAGGVVIETLGLFGEGIVING
jgi:hypothetical protein